MNYKVGDFTVSDEKELLTAEGAEYLLRQTYWAQNRPLEAIRKSIEHSLCIGIYNADKALVAFARCVTDYATIYYLCDVIVDEPYRGRGLGKALVEAVVNHEELKALSSLLITRDAEGLYEKYGYELSNSKLMRRAPQNTAQA